jgi:type I restriction enzyme, S subunit
MSGHKVPKGYKQTEVGVIPDDWEVKPLKELFNLGNGFSFKSEYFSSNGPILLTPGNFKLEGGLYFDDRNVKRYSGIFPESTIFDNGDLLVVMTDLTPNCNLLGKPAFVDSQEKILHNQRIGKVRLLTESLDKNFLYFSFLSNQYLKKIKEQATGSTVRHTSSKSIYSISLAIPPLSEQKLIARALSDIDALIEGLEGTIGKKRHIKQGAMQELLRSKDTWAVKTLGESCEIVTKGTTPTSIGRNFTGSGVNFLKAESISESGTQILSKVAFIDETTHKILKRSQLMDGDLLVSIAGVLGRIGKVEKDILPANTNQALAIVRLGDGSDFYRNYLFYYLRSTIIEKQISDINVQAAQANISLQNVKDFQIGIPPFLAEQQAIATILSDMDTEIATLEAKLTKTRQLKQGMMHELLTGRIRLV